MFAGTGSTIERGDGPFVRLEERCDLVEVVEGRDHRVARGAGGDAGRARDPERREPAAGAAREQRVGVTVVAAVELDQGVLPGGRASEADRRHRGLGAGGDESHLFDRRNHRDDPLGEEDLVLRRDAEGGAPRRRLDGSLDDLLPRVAEQQRSPRLAQVDVARVRRRPRGRHPRPGRRTAGSRRRRRTRAPASSRPRGSCAVRARRARPIDPRPAV